MLMEASAVVATIPPLTELQTEALEAILHELEDGKIRVDDDLEEYVLSHWMGCSIGRARNLLVGLAGKGILSRRQDSFSGFVFWQVPSATAIATGTIVP